MTGRKLYLAHFWRNDGGWHSAGYDLSPIYTFLASNDQEAQQLALGYIEKEKYGKEDFSIMELAELDMSIRKVYGKKAREKSGIPKNDLGRKIDAAQFTELDETLEGMLK